MPLGQKQDPKSASRFSDWFFGRKRKDKIEERRREKRYGVHDRVVLQWKDAGEERELVGQLLDRSENGFAVRAESEIEVGRIVSISGSHGVATGEVRNARPDEDEFVIGLELEADAD